MVACQGDRFLVEPLEPGRSRSARFLVAGAALGSLLLHGLVPLGLLGRPSDPVAAAAEIAIEVVVETARPALSEPSRERSGEPARTDDAAGHESAKARPEGLVPPAVQQVAAPPGRAPRALRPSSLGLDQEAIRAVPVPTPVERGDEMTRYDVIILGRLERAKQFPRQASLRRARGTALVGFALDATGRVLIASLLKSSGDRDLDVESVALIGRAAPFPPPPPGARRQFAVDVAFGLGG
jgi:TonB family protein